MRSHFSLNQGVAAACACAGAATLLGDACSGQTFIAADYATNSTYAAGWAEGQNGGYGWGPWSMVNTVSNSPDSGVQWAMDRAPGGSPYDPFGVAWTLYNPYAPEPHDSSCLNPPASTPPVGDVSRVGRAIPNGGLQPGQTFSTVVANPTERIYYKGYTILLLSDTNNIGYGDPNTQIAVGTFQYVNFGQWYTSETWASGFTPLLDTDTTTNGMQLDITMLTTNTYHLLMTPLGNPAIAYSEDGTLALPDQPVNWVTYQFYNSDSDFYPQRAAGCQNRTDFYIRSMTIAGLTLNVQRAGSDIVLSWPANVPGFNLESTPNLGSAAVWNPVSPLPSVVDGQNFVTNSVLGAQQQFYRLQYQP
jgi:hypothetical protein